MKMIEQKYAGTEPKGGSEGATKPIRAVSSEYTTKQSGCGASEDCKGGPGKGRQERWEAQWQQFLKTLQPLHPEEGSPPETPESAPWEDAKAFLASFEQVAKACRWPRGEWAARLLPALSGEADEAFQSLEVRDREDYGKVKAAILRGAALRTEAERQHFRQFCCQQVEDPRRIHLQLQDLCHRWLKPERRSKEQILELLVLEQFLASLPPELQSWIRAGGPESCSQAVALAEEFLMASQQDLAEAAEWQDVCVDSVDAEEVPSDVAQGRIYKDRDGEISLLGGDIKSSSNSGLLLPPEGREMAEVVLSEGLPNSKETGVPLPMFERTPTQPGQQTMFWQVLPEDNGNVLSFGEQKRCWIKRETSQRGETLPEDIHRACTEVPQWDFPLTSETHEQRCEGKGRQRKPVEREGERSECTEVIPGEQDRCWMKMEKSHLGENLPKEMHRELAGEFRRDISAVTPGIPEEKNNSKGQREKQPVKRETQCLSGVIAVSVSEASAVATDSGKPCRRKYKSENPFECPTSARDSHSVCCLEKLQGTLRGEKQNALPACGENLCGGEEFVGHQDSRTEESSHECPNDEKRFRHRHRNKNSGRKPHECSVCGKNFTFRAELARHHRIHTGEKPYGCSQCGRSFRQRTHLVRHQRIHTGELFQCTECGKGFSQRDTLKRHQRTHRTLLRPASSEGGESSNRGSMFAVQAPAIPVPVAIFPLGVASIRPQNGIELKKLSESP
uniref:zinc finger protein with KRAB and SCAN domains 1-like isoform X2 n=1 Tax=Podarcis muralis TaxID=64176 RepID=UPI0010A0074C|nr:zinc finger protein with KRAB and SCAN domains 1-like isoform X2 [Podarcis muralis]